MKSFFLPSGTLPGKSREKFFNSSDENILSIDDAPDLQTFQTASSGETKKVKSVEKVNLLDSVVNNNTFLLAIAGIPSYLVRNVSISKNKMIVHFTLSPTDGLSPFLSEGKIKAILTIISARGERLGDVNYELCKTDIAFGEHDFKYHNLPAEETAFSFRYDEMKSVVISVFYDICGKRVFHFPS